MALMPAASAPRSPSLTEMAVHVIPHWSPRPRRLCVHTRQGRVREALGTSVPACQTFIRHGERPVAATTSLRRLIGYSPLTLARGLRCLCLDARLPPFVSLAVRPACGDNEGGAPCE
jgi:hypothetical protein